MEHPPPPPPEIPPEVLKVAVHVLLEFMVMVHVVFVPQLEQSPLQPAKVEPESGVAVSWTVVPELKFAEHVEPQFIPDGLLTTVPVPVPDLLTLRVYWVADIFASKAPASHRAPCGLLTPLWSVLTG